MKLVPGVVVWVAPFHDAWIACSEQMIADGAAPRARGAVVIDNAELTDVVCDDGEILRAAHGVRCITFDPPTGRYQVRRPTVLLVDVTDAGAQTKPRAPLRHVIRDLCRYAGHARGQFDSSQREAILLAHRLAHVETGVWTAPERY